jgi:organic radical activating enzyme
MPAAFVRFAGCNLDCAFCDTDHRPQADMAAEEIVERVVALFPIGKHAGGAVVLTGGEPMLQVDRRLLTALIAERLWIALETNGTVEMDAVFCLFDWVCVSPKQGGELAVRKGDELKVVYEGQPLAQYDDLARSFGARYLQPCSMQNIPETIAAVKENPTWRLSFQSQKLLGIR